MTGAPGSEPTVTLVDRTVVSTSSEAFRHQCEAAHILCLQTLAQRRETLAGIEAKRGVAAADALRATMLALRAAR